MNKKEVNKEVVISATGEYYLRGLAHPNKKISWKNVEENQQILMHLIKKSQHVPLSKMEIEVSKFILDNYIPISEYELNFIYACLPLLRQISFQYVNDLEFSSQELAKAMEYLNEFFNTYSTEEVNVFLKKKIN